MSHPLLDEDRAVFGGMIDETPYDLRWRMFGVGVRVHPFFWVISALISWNLIELGIAFLLVGILAIFVSILLHELGHVFMGRFFGTRGHIVLWAFGGLAIGASALDNRWKRIAVYAAGPGIQLLLWGALKLALPYILPREDRLTPTLMETLLGFLLWINFAWAILNLLPIFPLDGGQITRDLFTHFSERNGVRLSLQVSIGVSALLALHAILAETTGRKLPIELLPVGVRSGIFFALFAVIGIQLLQAEMARDRWYDDRWS